MLFPVVWVIGHGVMGSIHIPAVMDMVLVLPYRHAIGDYSESSAMSPLYPLVILTVRGYFVTLNGMMPLGVRLVGMLIGDMAICVMIVIHA
jgi:hypothetical protein